MTFSEILKEWNRGIERGAKRRLAEAVGLGEAAVGRWVNGKGLPDETIRTKIAKTLGISVEELMNSLHLSSARTVDRELQSLPSLSQNEIHRVVKESVEKIGDMYFSSHPVPVVGTITRDKFQMSLDSPPDEFLPISIPVPSNRRCFALKVKTNSLKPMAFEGDYALIVATSFVDNGKLSVVQVHNDFMVRRVFRHGEEFELRSDNPALAPLHLPAGDFHPVGTILLFVRKPHSL